MFIIVWHLIRTSLAFRFGKGSAGNETQQKFSYEPRHVISNNVAF